MVWVGQFQMPHCGWKRTIFLLNLLGALYLLYIVLLPQERSRSDNFSRRVEDKQPCLPHMKIAFLKTHKCASTTVQNILFRYSVKHNLNVLLPSLGNYLGNKISFRTSMVKNTPWHHLGYHIFALHTIWNQKEVEKVMGLETKYVSILRDPVELFESLYSYAKLHLYYGVDIETFALTDKSKGNFSRRAFGYLGQNQMLWDFGFNMSALSNLTLVKQKIVEIEKKFDLIMIAERFDESLILLKDLMCWETHDITSFKLNARRNNDKFKLSSKTKKALQEWLWADQMLYDHIFGIFQKKKEAFGHDKMTREVQNLRAMNKDLYEFCVITETGSANLTYDFKLYGDVLGYQVRNESECRLYATSERVFINKLRALQTKKAMKSLGKHLPAKSLKQVYKH